MRCGKDDKDYETAEYAGRNPHECAVAKGPFRCVFGAVWRRNPHECAVAKLAVLVYPYAGNGRNPHECAEAKSRHCCARTGSSENMNYVLHF